MDAAEAQNAPCLWDDRPRSVGAFLDSVRAIRAYWRLPEYKEMWFRGEDGEYPQTRLCPKLYRPPENHPLKPIPDLLDIENSLFEDFERCGAQLCNTQPEDDWDWYFLMQHHGAPSRILDWSDGAPSRILDWSDGALIGLHFAVHNTPVRPERNAVVYVLQPHWLVELLKSLPDIAEVKERWKVFCKENPSEDFTDDEWDWSYLPDDEDWRSKVPVPRVPVLWDIAQITRRFGAQRSRFMIFGTDPHWMQDIAEKSDSVKVLTIAAASIPTIKHELRDAGITESVIFPDLDGLGRELMQTWEERR